MKNQRGFTLIGLLLTMSVLSLIAVGAVHKLRDHRERTAAKQYVDRVIYLAERLQLYNHHKTKEEGINPELAWPSKLDNLMSDYDEMFWKKCSLAEQQTGKCIRPESTLWDATITYNGHWRNYVELTIPYGSTGDMIKRWSAPLREQKKYPPTEMPNGDVKIRVDYLTDAVAYRDFLKRDGSTTLTNDWDVGNYGLLNTSKITTAGNNGTNRRLDLRYVGKSISGSRIDRLDNCPSDGKPDLLVSPFFMGSTKTDHSIQDVAQWYIQINDSNKNYWTVNILINAKNGNGDKKWREINDGFFQWEIICVQK